MAKRKTEDMGVIALRGEVLFPGIVQYFDVGREKSVAALEHAMNAEAPFFAVCQKDPDVDAPEKAELYDIGCVCEIKQVMPVPDGTLRVLANPVCRAKLKKLYDLDHVLVGGVERIKETDDDSQQGQVLLNMCKKAYDAFLDAKGEAGGETRQQLLAQQEPGAFADRFASAVINSYVKKQSVLNCLDHGQRAMMIYAYIENETRNVATVQEIQKEVSKRLERNNREYFLREQQRLIDEELGDDDEVGDYEKKLENTPMDEEAKERTQKELKRLKRAPFQSPEAAVMENYIEYMLELPWGKYTKDSLSVAKARKILDEDHYGLEEVKKRILEFLAVREVKQDIKSPILCLVGAPGVGKTSIARSIARCLGRKFCQVSLGGVRDEAELRGHRRTYVAAMPGRVISAIKQVGSMNPVFLFDEIDKMGADHRGDPAAAMLEILDPEQNSRFRDHYLEAPFDLSKVLFITTANTMDGIPKPLLDRMEVIQVPSYTVEEKLQIAKRHLWKKQLSENGMDAKHLKISDAALLKTIEEYTSEAGVRSLERTLGRLIRKITVEKLENPDTDEKPLRLTPELIEKYLGAPKYLKPETGKQPEVGAVNGLAWTSVGGVVMPIEVSVMPGSGKLELTGSLGNVMKESAQIALSFVRGHMEQEGITEEFRKTHDIHVHVPEGATPKDGPSAGIAIACAIYSALTGLKARQDVAMTGEISLRGKALPIGGVKEKLLAAYRLGINNVLLPKDNIKDLEEMPKDVMSKLNVVPIAAATDALKYVLCGKRA